MSEMIFGNKGDLGKFGRKCSVLEILVEQRTSLKIPAVNKVVENTLQHSIIFYSSYAFL